MQSLQSESEKQMPNYSRKYLYSSQLFLQIKLKLLFNTEHKCKSPEPVRLVSKLECAYSGILKKIQIFIWQVIDVEITDTKLLSLSKGNVFHKCYCYYCFEILVDIIGYNRI